MTVPTCSCGYDWICCHDDVQRSRRHQHLLDREVVQLTADWLDEHWPTEELGIDWANAIDTSRLAIVDPCRCVCGQLGIALARHEGYEIDEERELIIVGDRGIHGFAAFKSHDCREVECSVVLTNFTQSYASASIDVSRLIRKRLEFDELPRFADVAFGGGIGTSVWVDEIHERRRRDRG